MEPGPVQLGPFEVGHIMVTVQDGFCKWYAAAAHVTAE